MRQCHIRDAAALVQYLSWLEDQMESNRPVTEISGADQLEEFRSQQKLFQCLSFDSISGYGSNGAIIHYKPDREKEHVTIGRDSLYLIDSGGQYLDGTTDVTRTIALGNPSALERECYTSVLRGMIAVNSSIFPEGTTGRELDILARLPLWSLGRNYQHGTGHGVGSFLNVHEGPQGIGYRDPPVKVPLRPGMTTSNEPGYYRDGHFGIRIENVEVVVKKDTPEQFGGMDYLGFETLTMVPLDSKLIDVTMLDKKEIEWVNRYHQMCLGKVSPLLTGSSLDWLQRHTKPLNQQ
eukprot:TRINITY_DN2223_c0_g1_i1.p1 TRINITY_DN2223_c0_g1~~TRINITY_DN2223_c0_g1_i1.p1  ORF type:complete len:293 (-),score=57.07 TRINITY_DN2223_c0_g1_i1:25-903(-)